MTIMREERREDAHDLDNVTYNLAVVVALLAVGSVLLFRVKLGTPRGVGARPRPSVTLRGWGVPLRRVKSALRDSERKTFHLCGLLVPLIHLALLEGGFRQRTCILMAWAITSYRVERGPRAATYTVRRAALAPADDPAGPRARAVDGRVLFFSRMYSGDDCVVRCPVYLRPARAIGERRRRRDGVGSRRWRRGGATRHRRDAAQLDAASTVDARAGLRRRTCRAARLFFWCSATWPRR